MDAADANDATDGPEIPATCSPFTPFNAPALVPGMNIAVPGRDFEPRLSPDELTVYFARVTLTTTPPWGYDLYVATRSSVSDPFGEAVRLDELDTPAIEADPFISADGLTLFFASDRGRASQNTRIFFAMRSSLLDSFSSSQEYVTLSSPVPEQGDGGPYFLPDASAVYFHSSRRAGDSDIYRAPLGGAGAGTPVLVSSTITSDNEFEPVVTPDDLTLYYTSTRQDAGAKGGTDIWMVTRPSKQSDFGPPVNVSELNTATFEYSNWISADGCRFYFTRGDQTIGLWVYMAERAPI